MHWLNHNAQILFPAILLAVWTPLHLCCNLVSCMQDWRNTSPLKGCRDNLRVCTENEGRLRPSNDDSKTSSRSNSNSGHQLIWIHWFKAIYHWSRKICAEGARLLSLDDQFISLEVRSSVWAIEGRRPCPSNKNHERVEHHQIGFNLKGQAIASRSSLIS